MDDRRAARALQPVRLAHVRLVELALGLLVGVQWPVQRDGRVDDQVAKRLELRVQRPVVVGRAGARVRASHFDFVMESSGQVALAPRAVEELVVAPGQALELERDGCIMASRRRAAVIIC